LNVKNWFSNWFSRTPEQVPRPEASTRRIHKKK